MKRFDHRAVADYSNPSSTQVQPFDAMAVLWFFSPLAYYSVKVGLFPGLIYRSSPILPYIEQEHDERPQFKQEQESNLKS